ncbi:MAG: minichromosome maintenance protein MCM [Candidatus Micrarchaeota archaeon]|nr:minichromosome maintenance protein MCM [Candidatus Micrarchaeota archaeon]
MPAPAIDDSKLSELWEEFADSYCQNKLKQLEAQYPTKRSLVIDFNDIQKFDSELAEQVLEKPDFTLSVLEKVIRKPTAGVLTDVEFKPHVRVMGVPDHNLLIQNISSKHIDHLISVKGVISKRADVLHKVHIALYKCLMCDHRLRVPITKHTVVPENCPECRRRSLKLQEEDSDFVDIQRAEMQELLERLKGGTPAARLELYMEDDLVNSITPGDTMLVTGVVRLRPPLKTKNKNDQQGQIYTRYLDVLHIQSDMRDFEEIDITKEDETRIVELSRDPKIFERLYKSIAPGIYGHDEVKQAVTLQMFGGTKNKLLPGGEPIRDDIHLLLIGDPGSAKTRMVQYACDMVPKGIYVSGKSVTGVGLTASAEKDEIGEGGWTLKAGALVLASGGMAGVDEFDKIDEEDRASMHEVMESQTVSIAKAGMVAKFKAKCSILAAANPKFGRFDRNRLPAEQFDIPPTLLSRFDLIFVIFDTMDPVRDAELASKILANHRQVESPMDIEGAGLLDRTFVTKYIAYARRHCQPTLTNEASDKIKEYYVDLRKRGAQMGAVPITPRQIEGLVRMAEASAKLRLSPKVEAQDADLSIALQTFMINEILRDKETGRLDVDIIATGKPKSQVDKINNILGITRELQKQFDMVEINKILEEAAAINISEADARRIIDELIYKGELYKVKHGFVKVVEQYG